MPDKNLNVINSNHAKKSKRKKLFFFLLLPFLILSSAVVAYGYNIYSTAQESLENSFEDVERKQEGVSNLRADTVDPVEDNVSILIIGIDESEEREKEQYYRSDALLLATFNKKENNIKLLSIPRDSRVYVPEVGYETKINHAHFYGGPKATIETVEEFLNVPVDYYVSINFKAFMDVIDVIGGIDFNVPYDISEINAKGQRNKVVIEKGYQHLDGEQALALARTRKQDTDFNRGQRQQEIIKTVAKKLASSSSVLKIDDIIEAVGNNMKTNLTFNNITSFLSYGMSTNLSIETLNLLGDGGKMDDGLWYYNVDEESRSIAEKELRRHLNLPVNIPDPIQ